MTDSVTATLADLRIKRAHLDAAITALEALARTPGPFSPSSASAAPTPDPTPHTVSNVAIGVNAVGTILDAMRFRPEHRWTKAELIAATGIKESTISYPLRLLREDGRILADGDTTARRYWLVVR